MRQRYAWTSPVGSEATSLGARRTCGRELEDRRARESLRHYRTAPPAISPTPPPADIPTT